ncbi:MAG: protoheme farnesyltransferase [Candidatus Saccharibacteria bacterium]|nr:protoheme farnesyltransferase [Candidatus Saccharibacteria bacterium]
MLESIRRYYSLTKPGVLYGNALTVAAGYFLAAQGNIDIALFIAVFIGSSMIIASACVINNYLDQDIDAIMDRTKKRVLVSGEVKGYRAVIFSIILGLVGVAILMLYTNTLVVILGLIGFVTYVVFYGMLSKRLSIHGTLVGSISGAIPIIAGYCAASGTIDIGAVLVFIILFAWQFPEFYSIAIYRSKEYKAAHIPVLPVIKGVRRTKIEILLYMAVFVVSTLLLTFFSYVGYTYFVIMASLGLYWLWLSIKGFSATDDDAWARRVFRFSMIIILALCIMLSIGPILP